MSIIQDLYNIYDKERSKYLARKSSQNQLQIELQRNLAFIREGLREELPQKTIIDGLDDQQFRLATRRNVSLAGMQKKKLAKDTYAGIREFDRYEGWETARLIENAYERIAMLRKLAHGGESLDLKPRLRTLFKFLLVVLAHLKGIKLKVPKSDDA